MVSIEHEDSTSLLTVFGNNLIKHRHNQLLERRSRGVVDDGVLATLQSETDVQCRN